MDILIYTKSGCPNCVTAKAICKAKGLEYTEENLDDEPLMRAFLAVYPDARQMPQIFINNHRVGGLAGLSQALRQLGV